MSQSFAEALSWLPKSRSLATTLERAFELRRQPFDRRLRPALPGLDQPPRVIDEPILGGTADVLPELVAALEREVGAELRA